jgi:hypothetical protein
MVAYLKAVQQFNKGKTARNVEILSKHTGLDAELLQRACWPTISSDGQIDFESLLNFQRWAMKKGLLDSLVTKERLSDLSFAEYACQVLDIPARR